MHLAGILYILNLSTKWIFLVLMIQIKHHWKSYYECRDIKREKIDIFSVELGVSVFDMKDNYSMKKMDFQKKTIFMLKQRTSALQKNQKVKNKTESIKRLKILSSTNDTYQIFCKVLSGRTLCFDVNSEFTISDLKLLAQYFCNDQQPIEEIRLIIHWIIMVLFNIQQFTWC